MCGKKTLQRSVADDRRLRMPDVQFGRAVTATFIGPLLLGSIHRRT